MALGRSILDRVRSFNNLMEQLNGAMETIARPGKLNKVVGALHLGTSIVGHIDRPKQLFNSMKKEGYTSVSAPAMVKLLEKVIGHTTPTKLEKLATSYYSWEIRYYPGDVVRAKCSESYVDVTWFAKNEKSLPSLIQKCVWRGRRRIIAAIEPPESLKDSSRLVTHEIKGTPSVFGSPSPQEIAGRIKDRPGSTLMLIGPTGSGKSATALAAAMHLAPNATVLRLARSTAKEVSLPELRILLAAARPDLLIIDDVQDLIETLLDLLDNIETKYTILTYMDDDAARGNGKPGSLYLPGMRPGRVEDVLYIAPPSKEKVRVILQGYGVDPSDEVVELAHGLSGAYLRELASRIIDAPKQDHIKIVEDLKLFSPVLVEETEEDVDDDEEVE